MDDDRVRRRERSTEAREVLVVVEGIAAAPVDQVDPGIGQAPAVEVEGLARVEQHVRQPGERDGGPDRIRPLREGRRVGPQWRPPDVPERPVSAPEPAAREPDLAQHRGQGHDHPRGLLAVLDALERPVRVDQGPLRRHPAGQGPDRLGRDSGQPLGPLGGLGRSVLGATEVALEPVEADAVPREEFAVRAPLDHQRVRQREHHGDVGARHHRQPLGSDELRQVVPHRAQQHELRPAGLHRPEVIPQGVPARAARAHHGVLEREAAEADEEVRVTLDHRPGHRPVEVAAHVADHVRHDHGQRPVAVAVLPPDEAAEAVEEAMELALRVVEAARAGPAVGASVDGLTAVLVVDAAKLAREEVDGRRPAHRHEGLGAAAPVRAGAAVEPAGPDHGLGDPRPVAKAPGDVAEERRGVGIVRVWVDGDDRAARDFRLEGAPVGRVEVPLACHRQMVAHPRPAGQRATSRPGRFVR